MFLDRYRTGEIPQQIEMVIENRAEGGAAWSLGHTI
jgi:hypothetical protein